jgi:orotidine-5'-phosphate decarboxylase
MVSPVLLALDYRDIEEARAMAATMSAHVAGFKVGLELVLSAGPKVIAIIGSLGLPVFADAKLHDIPNTVAGAARALGGWGARWVTVHGSGGAEMIEAAVDGLGDPSGVLVVTVLTSHDAATLGQTGVAGGVTEQVSRIAALARSSGAGGVVCPPGEVTAVKLVDADLTVVTPGIRGSGSRHDQRQVSTPRQALEAGADYLVIGRAVTRSPDPVAALAELLGAP